MSSLRPSLLACSGRFPWAHLAWKWILRLGFTARGLAVGWPRAPVPSLCHGLGGSGFRGTCPDRPCPVPSCRCTRTMCTLQTASSTPSRRCFTRWGRSTPATWSSPPSTPPPRATWASMWAPTSLPHCPWACLVPVLLCPAPPRPAGQRWLPLSVASADLKSRRRRASPPQGERGVGTAPEQRLYKIRPRWK